MDDCEEEKGWAGDRIAPRWLGAIERAVSAAVTSGPQHRAAAKPVPKKATKTKKKPGK
jgi:hypothetical protein